MFTRILIANRGEIACRIIATARKIGILTVAVYSQADAKARHVELADEAVCIGPAEAAKSYLNSEAIIAAARQTGAEAIHPGYGFLSENPDFVEAVEEAGLVFIGPSAASIRAMGLKDAAKRLMEKAGVPVVPGYHGETQETVVLAGKANEIGYPVLIKARAGGGGKGMRKVDRAKEFRDALASARREAKSAFGDDRVLVEKYIEKPRHIEVQIFGDNHGNVVHLFERDCSLQRRHQKVIEEAPAPGMHDRMREAMTGAAVKAARAINYSGAGTVEFIVDASDGLRTDGFWFMEMNTRLQVEHPITEMITGIDLVEWQLRVAAGEKLPRRQNEIAFNGHAFEARIYAEDVAKGFLPATGTLHHLKFPLGTRVDTGVVQGDSISPFYDPMIAKLIVHGEDRQSALLALVEALSGTEIAGTVTNIAFLLSLAGHRDFVRGEVDTGLIDREFASLVQPAKAPDFIIAAAAVCSLGLTDAASFPNPFASIGNFAIWQDIPNYVDLIFAGNALTAVILPSGANRWRVEVPGSIIDLSLKQRDKNRLIFVTDNGRHEISIAQWRNHIALFMDGLAYTFEIADPLIAATGDSHSGDAVLAPMPGMVKLVNVKKGERVSKGQVLLVLEAMKMEHSLTAHRDGVVESLHVDENMQVADGAPLLELKSETGRS
jgi:3-methylcrotonyl-CoA carboxylase alpha subunit